MSGIHDFNFAEINKALHESGGLVYVEDGSSICRQITQWLENPDDAERAGEAGHRVVKENRGALDNLLKVLEPYFSGHR